MFKYNDNELVNTFNDYQNFFQMIKMMVTVVAVFTICWLPLNIFIASICFDVKCREILIDYCLLNELRALQIDYYTYKKTFNYNIY